MPPVSKPIRMGNLEWGLLLLLSVIWGASYLFIRIAAQAVPPLTATFARVVVAAMVLGLALVLTRTAPPRTWTAWRDYLVMGFLNNVIPFSLIFWSQQHVGAGLASVFNATSPFWGLVIAHLWTTDEKLRANKFAGVLVGIAGVAILVGPEVLQGFGKNVLSEAALIVAAISYGFASLWGRRFRETPPLTSAFSQLTCSSLMLLPLAAITETPWRLPMPGQHAIFALLSLAILCTAIAYIIFFTILRRAGAANVLLVTLLIPPSAILMGWLFLGEGLNAFQFAGAGVIGLALIVIDGRLLSGALAKPSAG